MFTEEFKATKSGKKLYLDYFRGSVIVDVESDRQAHKYLIQQVTTLDKLKQNILREADKFINE